jgi:hypothetical protein
MHTLLCIRFGLSSKSGLSSGHGDQARRVPEVPRHQARAPGERVRLPRQHLLRIRLGRMSHATLHRRDRRPQVVILSPEAVRTLCTAFQRFDAAEAQPDTYIPAPVVARMLGLRTGTLAKWRRQGKGPQNSFHTGETTVVYPALEVEAFLRTWKDESTPGCP